MQERIPGVDALRGLAALAVCWFHVTIGTANLNNGIVRSSGTYGWLGVELFFVISGFIIPYSLQRSGYKLKNYPVFLLKRITRLDPPYLASIVLVIAVTFFVYPYPALFRGKVCNRSSGTSLTSGLPKCDFSLPLAYFGILDPRD